MVAAPARGIGPPASVTAFGSLGSNPGQFFFPHGISANPLGGIYI